MSKHSNHRRTKQQARDLELPLLQIRCLQRIGRLMQR